MMSDANTCTLHTATLSKQQTTTGPHHDWNLGDDGRPPSTHKQVHDNNNTKHNTTTTTTGRTTLFCQYTRLAGRARVSMQQGRTSRRRAEGLCANSRAGVSTQIVSHGPHHHRDNKQTSLKRASKTRDSTTHVAGCFLLVCPSWHRVGV